MKPINRTARALLAMLLALVTLLSAASCKIRIVPQNFATKSTTEETKPDGTTETTARNDGTGTTATPTTKPTPTTAPDPEPTPDVITTAPTDDDDEPMIPDFSHLTTLPSQDVKIIGINVHNETTTVSERSDYMVGMLLSFMPDSIGVQECGYLWADAFEAGLGDLYGRVGIDVYGNAEGSFATYVYYLKDKYHVIDDGTFWLSETPDESSKYGPTVDMPRTCTWVILENLQTGFRYVHMNTHLDRLDNSVEAIQMQMVRNQILRFEEMGYPVFSTGDYNNTEGNSNYQLMLSNSAIKDSKYVAADATKGLGTFCNYNIKNAIGAKPIDFCFVTGDKMDVKQYLVIDQTYSDDVYVSDHFGIFVHATVKSLPRQTGTADFVPQFENGTTVMTRAADESKVFLEISFPQARCEDGTLAHSYRVQIYDTNQKMILQKNVSARFYCLYPPETVSQEFVGGEYGETYTVKITPISLFGVEGEPLVEEFVWNAEALASQKPNRADVLNLSIQNGKAVDSSPNAYIPIKYGVVKYYEDYVAFSGRGNLKIYDFEAHNDALADGFTVEAIVTTGSDIQSTQGYISNKESGGFNLECSSGTFAFYLHNGTSYVTVRTPVKVNTTYHVVCVFDGNSLKIYVDGLLVASEDFEGEVQFPSSEDANYLCIGADAGGTNGEYFATVDMQTARIYSDALTYENVLYLYQNR